MSHERKNSLSGTPHGFCDGYDFVSDGEINVFFVAAKSFGDLGMTMLADELSTMSIC